MKRNKNLETLSWEHHEGLVLTFRIEKGLKTNVDVKIVADYLLFVWNHVLEHHFWQEEQILNRSLFDSEKGRELFTQMISEHEQFMQLIKIIKQNNNDVKKCIEDFSKKLNDHIRFEERELFPHIEKVTPEKELKKMGDFLHKHHQSDCITWQPEFWRS